MKTIKTREISKGIKVLDKSVDLSKRIKDSIVRTKERAEETQYQRHDSPSVFAVKTVEDNTARAATGTTQYVRNPGKKALKNIERVNRRFQEVTRYTPKERQRTLEQAKQTAQNAKVKAESLKVFADHAQKTSKDAKLAVKEAKQSLRDTRQAGRKTLREVREKVKADRASIKAPGKVGGISQAGGGVNKQAGTSGGSDSGPGYLNKGVTGKKGADSTAKAAAKKSKVTAKGKIKAAKKTVKTAERTARQTVKTTKQTARIARKTAKVAIRAARVAAKAARVAAKAAVKATKLAVQAAIALGKAAVAAVRGLVALVAAGGWIAVLIILIICLIALIAGSVFGIFFSSEDSGTGQTITSVIAEIDAEYTGQIDAIVASNQHDLLDMSGARASWKQVLAIYTVKTVTDPSNPMEVAIMDDARAEILRTVFWNTNAISYSVDSVEIEEDVLDADGLPTGETEPIVYTVLRITVSRKAIGEMASLYRFSDGQNEWLAELMKPEYISLWNALLYGVTSVGDGSMIDIAETQLGNVGGETYWRWYGFSSREDWCACFVSWCAFQAGHIDAGIIPLFSSCKVGIEWFKDRGQWQDSGYTPAPGDLIFFDWEPDGTADHVGIVGRVDGGYVHTIEGNSSDSVRKRSYLLDSDKIFGYGVLCYKDNIPLALWLTVSLSNGL